MDRATPTVRARGTTTSRLRDSDRPTLLRGTTTGRPLEKSPGCDTCGSYGGSWSGSCGCGGTYGGGAHGTYGGYGTLPVAPGM